MFERKVLIESLINQAREKTLEYGDSDIAANEARILRAAAQMLNADADLHDTLEIAIRANEEARKKQEPALIVNRDGWPDGNRDTVTGNCPVCGNRLTCITPRYCNEMGFYCNMCGQHIRFV